MAQKAAKTEIANDVVRMPLKTVIDNQPVGAILRDARIAQGQDLAKVSDGLRIRRVYIEAIEEGRLADLPGLPYAIGFVRGYADYLGLDTPKLVERFKQEASDLEGKTRLILPEPIAVGRTPTGPVVLLSLMLLASAYGGWLYVSNKDAAQIDLIPPLPDSIAQLLDTDPAAPDEAPPEATSPERDPAVTAAPSEPAPVASAAEPELLTEPEPESVVVRVEAQPPIVEEGQGETSLADAAPEPEAQEIGAPELEAPELEAPEPTETATAETAAATETTEPSTPQQGAETPAPAPGLAESGDDAGAAESISEGAVNPWSLQEPRVEDQAAALARADLSAPAEPNAAPEAGPAASAAPVLETSEPVIYGAENTDSRVVIVARGPVWVEVTTAEGEVLLTRLLNDGDRFQAPNTLGLTLVTGNAGGLEFLVDGVAAPDIGPAGAVRRDVSLNPEALLQGSEPDAQ